MDALLLRADDRLGPQEQTCDLKQIAITKHRRRGGGLRREMLQLGDEDTSIRWLRFQLTLLGRRWSTQPLTFHAACCNALKSLLWNRL